MKVEEVICPNCGRPARVRSSAVPGHWGEYKVWYECRRWWQHGPFPPCKVGDYVMIDREWFDYGVKGAGIRFRGVQSKKDALDLYLGDNLV